MISYYSCAEHAGRCKEVHVPRAADAVGHLREVPSRLQFRLMVLPQQLLAHHVAEPRGTDVDQSRNLAESVAAE